MVCVPRSSVIAEPEGEDVHEITMRRADYMSSAPHW
jgi:hypothetical protein